MAAPRQWVAPAIGAILLLSACNAILGIGEPIVDDGAAGADGGSGGKPSGVLQLGEACASGVVCSSGHCADGVCCDLACEGNCAACNLPDELGRCVAVPGDSCGAKPIGSACTSDGECLSAHCADGVCCDAACTGVCETCDQAANPGTCRAKTGAAVHGGTCSGSGACAGSCDGRNRTACVNPSMATACDDGKPCTYGDHCDGDGTCVGTAVTCPADTPCTIYACNGTSTCTEIFDAMNTHCGSCPCGEVVCDGMGNCNKPLGCQSPPCP